MRGSRVARSSLSLVGWEFEGEPPKEKKYVVLAVPHTSNWDGLLLVALTRSIGLKVEWMVKNEWTRGPLGPVVRGFGGVGVDRSKSTHMVDQMIDEFRRRDELVLAIPPEGTRSRAEYWRSGFYRIALGAQVPVAPGYLDFGRKRAGIAAPFALTGDVKRDMDRIRAFYAEKNPIPFDPSNFGPIRLREEVTERT